MIVLKSAVTRDGREYRVVRMQGTENQPKGARVRFFGREIGFTELQMYALGQFAVSAIKERVSRGTGSDDAPMPALQSGKKRQRWSQKQQRWVEYGEPAFGYRTWKARLGLPGIRNLALTGKMLSDFSVRSVSAQEVRMDITTTESRMKARTNEIRAPWFGWSSQDMAKIWARAGQMFGNLGNVGISMVERSAGVTVRTAAPIWMRGYQNASPRSLDARIAEERWRTRTTRIRAFPRKRAA